MLDILAADGGAATAAVGTARPSTDLRTHHSLTHARTHSRAHGARTHAHRSCVSLRVYTHVDAHVCLHVGACLHTRAPRFPHPTPPRARARAWVRAHTHAARMHHTGRRHAERGMQCSRARTCAPRAAKCVRASARERARTRADGRERGARGLQAARARVCARAWVYTARSRHQDQEDHSQL